MPGNAQLDSTDTAEEARERGEEKEQRGERTGAEKQPAARTLVAASSSISAWSLLRNLGRRRCSTTRARAAEMTLPHSTVLTPVFMPVGTQGTLKGLLPEQMVDLDCRIMLSNTYHLGNR